MIGKTVTVTEDRVMGTYHPEHPDLYYPINYGNIKGIIAPEMNVSFHFYPAEKRLKCQLNIDHYHE